MAVTQKNAGGWVTVSLQPLAGVLDTRSRPADVPPGGFRWKQNWSVTPEGKLCRSEGFDRAFAEKLYDANGVLCTTPGNDCGKGTHYHNHDLHRQNGTREPITFLYESTDNTGFRRLFAGAQSWVKMLNESTGQWTDIITGKGAAGSVWRAAALQDIVLFTNNVDNPIAYNLDTAAPESLADLITTQGVTAARVVVEFNGMILFMNLIQSGTRNAVRIIWSDLNLPLSYTPNPGASLAGFQDLDYGDEILAATPMVNALYILTRRAIWRCDISSSPDTPFTFTRVYHEPKNQTGCIVYPFTLVSTGTELMYMSREAVYWYNPYMDKPQRASDERGDWLYRGSGVIFKMVATALSGTHCLLPIAEYLPTKKELWISWPASSQDALGNPVNNWTFVANFDQRTAGVVDAGFTAMVNFRKNPIATSTCNEAQSFLAASGLDWCIKDLGGVFFREYVEIDASGDLTVDLPAEATYRVLGYNSILRGMVPLGLYDRYKVCRSVILDDDVSEQVNPCRYRLRLGNSFNIRDPNDLDNECAVQWREVGTKPVACIDGATISAMTAKNLKPAIAKDWPCYEENRFLYFELTVENGDGTAAIGADLCAERIDFDCLVRPKP